jgi:hypothetical protein
LVAPQINLSILTKECTMNKDQHVLQMLTNGPNRTLVMPARVARQYSETRCSI